MQKRKVKEGIFLLMNMTGKQVTTHKDSEVLNNLFTTVFTGTSLPTPLEWMDHKMRTEGAKFLSL